MRKLRFLNTMALLCTLLFATNVFAQNNATNYSTEYPNFNWCVKQIWNHQEIDSLLSHHLNKSHLEFEKSKETIKEKVKDKVIVSNFNWEPVIKAIAKVESGMNPNAVSKSGRYVGYLQISPVLVRECNNIVGYAKYTLNDRFSVEKSKEMFILIQKKYNPTCNIEKAIRLWNGGSGYTIKGTQHYYSCVMKHY